MIDAEGIAQLKRPQMAVQTSGISKACSNPGDVDRKVLNVWRSKSKVTSLNENRASLTIAL